MKIIEEINSTNHLKAINTEVGNRTNNNNNDIIIIIILKNKNKNEKQMKKCKQTTNKKAILN